MKNYSSKPYEKRMLGNILRSPENSPASLALHYAVVGHKVQKIKGQRGAHEMNLLKVIRKDLEVTAVYDEEDKEYRLDQTRAARV